MPIIAIEEDYLISYSSCIVKTIKKAYNQTDSLEKLKPVESIL
ncbi:MAG: hypothetical protein QXY40_03000 [Candidatus Methanomethylicia archaeon]